LYQFHIKIAIIAETNLIIFMFFYKKAVKCTVHLVFYDMGWYNSASKRRAGAQSAGINTFMIYMETEGYIDV